MHSFVDVGGTMYQNAAFFTKEWLSTAAESLCCIIV